MRRTILVLSLAWVFPACQTSGGDAVSRAEGDEFFVLGGMGENDESDNEQNEGLSRIEESEELVNGGESSGDFLNEGGGESIPGEGGSEGIPGEGGESGEEGGSEGIPGEGGESGEEGDETPQGFCGDQDCDDGNLCTDDSCDELTGCVFEAVADGETCNDGDSCTIVDICKDGVCAGTAKPCPDDDNPCTTLFGCDEESGDCLFVDIPDGTYCDDGNACTNEDVCVGGECLSTGDTECNDGNPCTDDGCNPKGGCTFFPNQALCDDGTLCTINDTCLQGQCKGEVLACDDGNPCTNDGCDPEKGCDHVPVTGPCEDGNPCTLNDLCEDGICASGSQKSCDDGNPCSDEYCALESGNCVYAYIDAPCTDGDICTEGDNCKNGVCKGGTPLNCDDNNVCTNDSCDPATGCQNIPAQGPCSDGDTCTTQDFCDGGTCVGGVPLDCNDGKECTEDFCEGDLGCMHTVSEGPCNENNLCTVGTCGEDGTCNIESKECDDGNQCTIGGCSPAEGCIFQPLTGIECEDGSACTEGELCASGVCFGGYFIVCDDGEVCTTDSCEPELGCVFENNEVVCSDGSQCAEGICLNGDCISEPVICDDDNVCTSDTCIFGSGCLYLPNTESCDDGDVCTLNDACAGAACLSGPVNPCDDGNECTADSCQSGVGCAGTELPGSCDDNEPCTVGTCVAGECSKEVTVCDDGEVCTLDTCVNGAGCSYQPQSFLACDDDNSCTSNDQCLSGVCIGGSLISCDDGDPCTDDSCSSDAGCVHDVKEVDCDDESDVDGCAIGCPTENSCAAAVAPLSTQCVSGTTWVVSKDGGGDFISIQSAIDAAGDCDVIEVEAGVYAESVTLSKPLSLIGSGAAVTEINQGVTVLGSFDGLTLEGFTLKGDGPGEFNAVINASDASGEIGDVTIRYCVLDGENQPRRAFSGKTIGGTWIWEGNEIHSFDLWYVIDNTLSTATPPVALEEVYFINNYVHDVRGSIAFRGTIGMEIDKAVVAGNTGIFDDVAAEGATIWAFVEVNNAKEVEVYDNYVSGIPPFVSKNEGHAFQLWSTGPWTVDIHDNEIVGNYQGMHFTGYLVSGPGYPLYVPSGEIYNNSFVGNEQFGLWLGNNPPLSAESSAIGGPLDARNNWWGDDSGPTHPGNPGGTGELVADNVLYDPWLTSYPSEGIASQYCGPGIPESICGDGIQTVTEECDDGNTTDGDGCSSTCTL